MKIKLSENIRAFRKEHAMTQEQLAEVLNVTVGAVYKWESGQSMPELGTIVELADLFDTSVDVLLGYEMKDNRLQTTIKRLEACRHEKNRDGLAEAEKALRKYPNVFAIVYNSALLFWLFGIEDREKALLRRALELFENAKLLLTQNDDPQINETTICGNMADILLKLERTEEAVELMKSSNIGGLYDARIGLALAADSKKPEESVPFFIGSADELCRFPGQYGDRLCECVLFAAKLCRHAGDHPMGDRHAFRTQGRRYPLFFG